MSQANIESQTPKKNKLIILIILILFLIFVIFLIFSRSQKPTSNSSGGDFFSQSNKHGIALFKSGIGEDNQIEFWFSGDKYRLTWFNPDGSTRLHMICPDGKNLYFSEVATESTKIGYINPIMHTSIFNGPKEFKNKTENQEGDYQVTTYDIDQLWDVEGASQNFYLKDLKIYKKDDAVEKIIARTSSNKPETEEDLTTSTYTIQSVDYPNKMDSKVFEFPYPLNK
jgi:hypothetical protein